MQKMPFPEPFHKLLSPSLNLEELGIWGVLVTLPNHLVSQGRPLVLPGSEDGDEERGNWPFFPTLLTIRIGSYNQQHLLWAQHWARPERQSSW